MTDTRFTRRPEISQDLALALVTGACQAARAQGLAVAVAVVDRAGEPVACARMDGAPLGAMGLAGDKAYTAAVWRMPSGDLNRSTQPGGDDWGLTSTAGGRIVVYPGGVPIAADGEFAGAIGVSGGTGEQDAAVAVSALQSLNVQPLTG